MQSKYHPKNLFTYIGFGLWYGLAQLPYSIIKVLAKLLTCVVIIFKPKRYKIIKKNIELCFGNLADKEQRQIISQSCYSIILAIFQTGMLRSRPKSQMLAKAKFEDEHNLDNAIAKDKGVILLSFHFNYLEATMLIAKKYPYTAVYREHKNIVHDKIQIVARNRYLRSKFGKNNNFLISKTNIRGMIDTLKSKKILGMAPDQDLGRNNSVFADFFGVTTATVTSISKLAKISGAAVVPLQIKIDSKFNCTLKFERELPNFPSGDLVADATQINKIIERQVLQNKAGYMWAHRRFKTQPRPEDNPYLDM